MEDYKIVLEPGTGEIVEKKSRFIANIVPVESEEEAQEYIEKMKKKYWDARHNCSAFVIGRNHEIKRFSDDGEPSGTAGKPMLDILVGNDIHNAVVVVTRYFGGTLLGTGGLIRAYSQATKEGLENAVIGTMIEGINVSVETDYNGIGKIQYIAGQMGIKEFNPQFTDKVIIDVTIKKEDYDRFEKKVTEATNGKAVFANKIEKDFII